MEAEILDTLDTMRPMTTRKLMTACGVRDTKTIGSISDDAFDFIKLLEKMQAAGHIRLIERQGFIKGAIQCQEVRQKKQKSESV